MILKVSYGFLTAYCSLFSLMIWEIQS